MPISEYHNVTVQTVGRTVSFTLFKETDDPERPIAVAEVSVTFDKFPSERFGVSEVSARSYTEPLTPSELARLSWAKWLKAAETIYRTPRPPIGTPGGDNVLERLSLGRDQWAEYSRQIQAAMGRSGRRGLDRSHYERVARMYLALVADGERAPVKKLTESLGANYHTVSRWIRTAREMKILSDGQQGRSG